MGVRNRLLGTLAAFCSAGLLCAATGAYAMDLSGRVSESFFNANDDAASQNYNYVRTKLRLDATNLNGADNSFHFDGSYLGQGQNTYNSQIPADRVDALNLRLERLFADTDFVLGRQMIDSLIGAKIDGALFEHHSGEAGGWGVFGGTLPDPYTDAFASSYPAYGAYGYYRAREKGATLGYATSMYNGREDQAYIFGSAYFSPSDSLNANASARFDHNLNGGNGYYVTNLLLSANYRWGWLANANLTYNQYRAVWYQESMAYGLNYDLQQSVRLYGDYSVSKSARIYADVDCRQRDMDGKSAYLYMVGFRDSNLMGWMYYNAGYRNINYFTSLSSQFFVAGGAQSGDRISGELGATYSTNSQDGASNTMTQMIYSAGANYTASKSLTFNCLVEMSDQKFLSVDSVYLAKYKDEYMSTSVFANLSYRF